jgi:hypothetical protein
MLTSRWFSFLRPRLPRIPSVVVGKRHVALATTETKRLAVCNIRTSSRPFRGQSSNLQDAQSGGYFAVSEGANCVVLTTSCSTTNYLFKLRHKAKTTYASQSHSFPPSSPLPFIFPSVSCSRATSNRHKPLPRGGRTPFLLSRFSPSFMCPPILYPIAITGTSDVASTRINR